MIVCFGDRFLGEGFVFFIFISAGPFFFGLPTYPFAGIKPFVVLRLRVKVAFGAHLLGLVFFFLCFGGGVGGWGG